MKKHIICITGNIAVGKSEVSKRISETLGWSLYKASNSFRETARSMNMNLVDFCEYVSNNPEIDIKIEETTKRVVQDSDNMVVDARLGFYIAPEAYKVYMTCDLDEAAKRLLKAAESRGKEEDYTTLEESKNAIIARENAERERYKKLYNIDIGDLTQYDLVIDTTSLSSSEVAEQIIKAYRKWEGQ